MGALQGPPPSRMIPPTLAATPRPRDNNELKNIIMGEIRKPGKNYGQVVRNLNFIQGDKSTKQAFVREVVAEAQVLKKRELVQLLEAQMESL